MRKDVQPPENKIEKITSATGNIPPRKLQPTHPRYATTTTTIATATEITAKECTRPLTHIKPTPWLQCSTNSKPQKQQEQPLCMEFKGTENRIKLKEIGHVMLRTLMKFTAIILTQKELRSACFSATGRARWTGHVPRGCPRRPGWSRRSAAVSLRVWLMQTLRRASGRVWLSDIGVDWSHRKGSAQRMRLWNGGWLSWMRASICWNTSCQFCERRQYLLRSRA